MKMEKQQAIKQKRYAATARKRCNVRFGKSKNWNEQLASYFGKVDLDIDIDALRAR
jgi:hypothetical protein